MAKIETVVSPTRFRSSYHKVAVNITYTAGWLANEQKQIYAFFDLTLQQFHILTVLRERYPYTMSGVQLKARMLDKNSDISRLIDRFVSKNLITKTRSLKDQRAYEILINEKGLNLLSDIDIKLHELDTIISNLSAQEAEQVSMLLDKMRG